MGRVVMAVSRVPGWAVMPVVALAVEGWVCRVGNRVISVWLVVLVVAECRSRKSHLFLGYCQETR
jgi:hypothetical protein